MDADQIMEHLIAQMRAKAPEDAAQIPPNVFVDMDGSFIVYQEGVSLTVRFPVQTRYQNPLGLMQGGMIVAAIDNAIGPLSYLVAPPSVTMQLNTSYLRKVTPEDAYIEVEARVVERAGKHLYLSAEVRNPAGQVVALAHATCALLPQRDAIER